MQRGQSLIVWAIAEGRSAARGVDANLMGASKLPAPLP
jgi:glutamate synthase (NADPH/NADH) small chain